MARRTSRFSSDEIDEDEEAPRSRRGGRRDRDEDEEETSRRPARGESHRDRDDEDETPRSRRGGRSRDDESDSSSRDRGKSTSVGKGWSSFKDRKSASTEYVNSWKIPEDETLFKFLEEEPFSVYDQHWLDEITKGKRSFICLGDDCPLCDDLGDTPSSYALFNILDLSNPDKPSVEVLQAGIGLSKKIQKFAEEKRSTPLNGVDKYFIISREKKKNARAELSFIRGRDVEEDFSIAPFTEEELEEFEDKLVSEEQIVFIDTKKRLKEIVDDVSGE